MNRLITVPSVFSGWLENRQVLTQALQTVGCRALCIVGSSVDVRGLLSGRLRVPGLEQIEIGLCSPSDREAVVRLAAAARQGGIRFSADHVLLGDRSTHDSLRGGLPSFDDTFRSLHSLRDEEGIAASVTIPLWPETVPGAFALWYRLVREGIPFAATLGRLSAFDRPRRYMAMELLENLAHHPTTPEPLQYAYEQMRRRLEDEHGAGPAEQPQIAGGGDDQEVVRRALNAGLLSPDVDRPPFRWKVGRFVHGHKIDNGVVLLRGLALLGSLSVFRRRGPNPSGARPGGPRALVVGWYGTETAGDKAILGGLLQGLRQGHPDLRATVASMLPFYTRQTLDQLGVTGQVDVVPMDFRILEGLLPSVHLALVGGGPLMDLVELFDLLRVFVMAQRAGVPRVIAGCGIGPAQWPFTPAVIKKMVGLSDGVVLRDEASLSLLRSWGVETAQVRAGRDPALAYIAQLPTAETPGTRDRPLMGMAVREWPWKFGRSLGKREFDRRTRALSGLWADVADWFIEAFDGQVSLVPMHTLHVGGDDRWCQAGVRERMRHPDRALPHLGSYTPVETAGFLRNCDMVIAMRYHSVLFTAIQGRPFLAIDYTQGGKIGAFMREIGMSEWLLDLETADFEDVRSACTNLWERRAAVHQELVGMRGSLVQESLLAGHIAASHLPPRASG